MRSLDLLLLLTLFVCLLGIGMGQCTDTFEPGCKMSIEVGSVYRHCIDPTKFWYCPSLNAKAELRRCPPSTGFDQDRHTCIPWISWVWKTCTEPPSRPTGVLPCGD